MTDQDGRRVDCAVRAARSGASVAADSFRSAHDVETKSSKTDVVTQVDHAAQDRVVQSITEVYPDEPIVGEEGKRAGSVPPDGTAWIVDPIDGTANYVRGIPTF